MKHNYPILVIETKKLFQNNSFEGFKHADEINFEKRILNNSLWKLRYLMEENPEYQQPICYSIIINPKTKKVFAYQRANRNSETSEARLNNRWTWGVGGHVEKIDENSDNPLHTSMLRELHEEVDVQGDINPKVIGYINDNSTEISKVHFGLIYVVETDAEVVLPKASEIAQGSFHTVEEIEQMLESDEHQIEEWSKISFEPIKNYLKK